jgi:hypothetical protein
MTMAKNEAETLMRATPVAAPAGAVLPRGNAEIPGAEPPAPPAPAAKPTATPPAE